MQADGFDEPSPTAWRKEQLSEFCAMAEFGLGFVPSDALLVPPENNYYDAEAFARVEVSGRRLCARPQPRFGELRPP